MSNKKRADLLSKEKKTGNDPYEKRRKKKASQPNGSTCCSGDFFNYSQCKC